MVDLADPVLGQYAALSLYNSPYPAHEAGRAIDLYPGPARDAAAPSPVGGEVIETRTVSAPSRSHGVPEDHLIVVDTGDHLARILHVDPAIEAGEGVAVGDHLGTTVRSGYFDPWVDDHLHLGFRPRDADPIRATGSLPIDLDLPIEAVEWNGEGEVVERAETFVVLDSPTHPEPGEAFAGVAASGGALDGGLPHYPGGGVLGIHERRGRLALLFAGERVGTVRGDRVEWGDVEVLANGEPIEGVSLALWREEIRVKLVDPEGIPFREGDRVRLSIR